MGEGSSASIFKQNFSGNLLSASFSIAIYFWYFDGVQNKLTQLLVVWTTLALIELCLYYWPSNASEEPTKTIYGLGLPDLDHHILCNHCDTY